MKKISLTFCLAFLSSLFCPAQVSPLQFNKNGEFKIVQFTDIHFKYGNPASDIALKRIGEVLDAECPDLVVFTGDMSMPHLPIRPCARCFPMLRTVRFLLL
jgi:predicted MPP superfamily phosphohydrolase